MLGSMRWLVVSGWVRSAEYPVLGTQYLVPGTWIGNLALLTAIVFSNDATHTH